MIIPSDRSRKTLPRTLQSLEVAAAGLDVETIVVEDADGRGPSWARNRGLDKAKGDFIFFCDADDTVRPQFFRKLIALLEESGADLAISSFEMSPLKRDYNLSGRDEVRRVALPAFLGYSLEDVRRWNSGGSLMARREMGSVCRCAFRRGFLRSNNIRFDERARLYEDGMFLAECIAFAEKTASTREVLYDYVPGECGNMATGTDSRRHWDYKFIALEARKRIDGATGGAVWKYCEASSVFSALEMMRLWRKAGLTPVEFREGLSRYVGDGAVASALRRFPLSVRHPLVAAAVVFLRIWAAKHG